MKKIMKNCMKKYIRYSIIIGALFLCACGNNDADENKSNAGEEKNTDIVLDYRTFAGELTDSIAFDGEMSELSSEMAVNIFDISDLDADVAAYMGTAPYRDMVVIIDCPQGKLDEVEERMDSYLDDAYTASTDNGYAPAEGTKIENCIKKSYGNYYIVIVAPDSDEAKKVLDEKLDELT